MKDIEVHIGAVIEQIFRLSGMEIDDFAYKINRQRTGVYYLFKQKTINVDLLILISKALNYNFFNEYDYFTEKSQQIEKNTLIIIDKDKKYRATLEEI